MYDLLRSHNFFNLILLMQVEVLFPTKRRIIQSPKCASVFLSTHLRKHNSVKASYPSKLDEPSNFDLENYEW